MPSQTDKPRHIPLAEPASTETYAAAFARLNVIAEKLKGGAAASIDTLVEDVRAARAAHQVCARRIAAVRAEIDAELASDLKDASSAA